MISRKSIKISERDRRVLLFIFKNKIASIKQVHNLFFNGRDISIALRRMNKLYKYSVVKKGSFFIGNKLHVSYSISDLGVKVIQPYLVNKVDSHRYCSDSIEHDLALGDITYIFEQLSIVKAIHTESELLSCSKFIDSDKLLPFIELRSDRACLVEGAERTDYLALEYERTLKSKERNKSKFERYYLASSIPAVLYVCETASLMRSLMKIDSSLCLNRKSKLYFCLREDVQKNSKKITFSRFDGKILAFV